MELEPRQLARLAGALYLLNILGGAFAIGFVPAVTGGSAAPEEVLTRAGLAAHVATSMKNATSIAARRSTIWHGG